VFLPKKFLWPTLARAGLRGQEQYPQDPTLTTANRFHFSNFK
jgi:hypothetical protein